MKKISTQRRLMNQTTRSNTNHFAGPYNKQQALRGKLIRLTREIKFEFIRCMIAAKCGKIKLTERWVLKTASEFVELTMLSNIYTLHDLPESKEW